MLQLYHSEAQPDILVWMCQERGWVRVWRPLRYHVDTYLEAALRKSNTWFQTVPFNLKVRQVSDCESETGNRDYNFKLRAQSAITVLPVCVCASCKSERIYFRQSFFALDL